MSEADMRGKVTKVLSSLDAIAVENPAYIGTPDVNYIGGWLELKWLRKWPTEGSVVKIDHFTTQQRTWLRRRWLRGGACGLLFQCRREWLLFHGPVAAEHVGLVPRGQLRELACWRSEIGLNKRSLLGALGLLSIAAQEQLQYRTKNIEERKNYE